MSFLLPPSPPHPESHRSSERAGGAAGSAAGGASAPRTALRPLEAHGDEPPRLSSHDHHDGDHHHHHRELSSYYWDVAYTVLVPRNATAYDDDGLTPTTLASHIVAKLRNATKTSAQALVIANVTDIEPELSTLAAIGGITRSPTQQPSSPRPSPAPTHPPTTSVVPSNTPTPAPSFHKSASPTHRPTHAPTLFHIVGSEAQYTPSTPLVLRAVVASVPFFVVLVALVAVGCCKWHAAGGTFCEVCFPLDVDASLVMFSNFAGGDGDADVKAQDDKYVTQHRTGGVYTWAKQFHAKYIVGATPSGLALTGLMRNIEMEQLGHYKAAAVTLDPEGMGLASSSPGGGGGGRGGGGGGFLGARDSDLVDFTSAVDEGRSLQPSVHGFADDTPVERKLDVLEGVAVEMARKQQELVNALVVSEEKHATLAAELGGLTSAKGEKVAFKSLYGATETLGRDCT